MFVICFQTFVFGPRVKDNEKFTFVFIEYDSIAAPVQAIKEKDGDELEGTKLKVRSQGQFGPSKSRMETNSREPN